MSDTNPTANRKGKKQQLLTLQGQLGLILFSFCFCRGGFVLLNFLILFQELNVAMVIKEFNILMLKNPLNPERYKILLMIYFLIYRNLLEFIIFVQSYFHYL